MPWTSSIEYKHVFQRLNYAHLSIQKQIINLQTKLKGFI